jgi:hypothetical protein
LVDFGRGIGSGLLCVLSAMEGRQLSRLYRLVALNVSV